MTTVLAGQLATAAYADERGEWRAICRICDVGEHLLTLTVLESIPTPEPGAIVDLEFDGRNYRSTVQRSHGSSFVLLRPRELDPLSAVRAAIHHLL